jgi:hypothetical protein
VGQVISIRNVTYSENALDIAVRKDDIPFRHVAYRFIKKSLAAWWGLEATAEWFVVPATGPKKRE